MSPSQGLHFDSLSPLFPSQTHTYTHLTILSPSLGSAVVTMAVVATSRFLVLRTVGFFQFAFLATPEERDDICLTVVIKVGDVSSFPVWCPGTRLLPAQNPGGRPRHLSIAALLTCRTCKKMLQKTGSKQDVVKHCQDPRFLLMY